MLFDSVNDGLIREGGSLELSPTWVALAEHQREIAHLEMRELFRADSQRYENFSLLLRVFLSLCLQ